MRTKLLFILCMILLVSSVTAQYDTTNITESNSIYDLTKALNDLTEGTVGIGFVLVVFVITFIVTTANTGNALSGLSAGSFIATLTSLIFMPLNLVGFPVFLLSLLALAGSVSVRLLIK